VALVVLDASVFIAFRSRDDAHHEGALAAMTTFGEEDLVLPASAYSEALVEPSQRGGRVLARAKALIAELPIRVQPIDTEIAERAAVLRGKQRVRLPDALVLATGDVLGAEVVLTADERWRKLSTRVQVI
jgi:predicted nucleic acid-binding protein